MGAEERVAAALDAHRKAYGLSYVEMADRMTAVGCPIDQSALWKMTNAEPRRRVTVDEFVAASVVLGVSLAELAGLERPVEESAENLWRRLGVSAGWL